MREIDPIRLARAVHLDAIRRDDVTWRVTGVDSFHVVTDGDTGLLCDCRDFAIRGGPCKHVIRIDLANGDREMISALRLLIPNPRRLPAQRRGAA
jgi:hypothetical protein